jgi:glycerophosphoryl diester phosphodiesterase
LITLTADKHFTVIAHRGASGYLPEHTLEGIAMAHAMGSDYIEQDVALTRDNVLIVLHDLYLNAVTDVAEKFPGRQRGNDLHYAIDFTLEEIRSLCVHERMNSDAEVEFPDRFPHQESIFHIPTLAEEITLIQGLNRSRGRNVGIYIEPKSPAWHTNENKDVVKEVVNMLNHFGYQKREDKACLQSFDTKYLEYARHQLKTDLKLVQLIGDNSWRESDADFDFLQTREGLASIAGLADGIGPWLLQVMSTSPDETPDISDMTANAQSLGLFVHAYTLRADQLPAEIGGIENAAQFLANQVGLDGVFTDHPDQVIRACR